MATKLHLVDTKTNALKSYSRDLGNQAPSGALLNTARATTTAGGTKIRLDADSGNEIGEWVTGRAVSAVTISGTVTLSLAVLESVATVNSTVRAEIFRITAGGSDVESLVGAIELTAEPTTGYTTLTATATFPSSVLSVGERLILRLYAIPFGGTMGAGFIDVQYNVALPSTSNTWIEFTENIEFLGAGSQLYFRTTTVNGISGFRDLTPSPSGSPGTNAVVNAVSGSTDIQWTVSAGGALIAWISPRIKNPVSFTTASPYPQLTAWGLESGNSVNAQPRIRVWKRDPAGIETLLWGPYNKGSEFTTGPAKFNIQQGTPAGTPGLTATLAENDRIVVRMYITNSGTMGNGTCNFNYDGRLTDATGYSSFAIGVDLLFKAEGDPDTTIVPASKMTMTGMGS